MFHHLGAILVEAGAARDKAMDQPEPLAQILGGECVDQLGNGLRVNRAQHLLDLLQRYGLGAKAEHLVKQADGIAHAALRAAGDRQESIMIGSETFGSHDVLEMTGNLGCRDAPKVKALAAAEHSGGNLVRLGRGQDETSVGRRLF
jgi:hypothetical protein